MAKKNEELEFTQDMIERNDEIDNTVYNCICVLAEKEIEWDMEIIGDVTDAIKEALAYHGIKVRQPSIVTEADGTQHYED